MGKKDTQNPAEPESPTAPIEIHVGPGLAKLLMAEAADHGVTPEEYVHDAALARMIASTMLDDQQRVEHLAAAIRAIFRQDPGDDPIDGAEIVLAILARFIEGERGAAAEALTKQRDSDSRPAATRQAAANMRFVLELWDAMRHEGIEAVARLVPDDVVWQPLAGRGRLLRSTEQLRSFWGKRTQALPAPRSLRAYGDDVVLHIRLPTDPRRGIWCLYRFDRDRLTHAITFDDELELRRHLDGLHAGAANPTARRAG